MSPCYVEVEVSTDYSITSVKLTLSYRPAVGPSRQMRKSASSTGLLAGRSTPSMASSSSRTTLSTSSSTVGAELAPSSTPMLALCRLVREMKLPRGDRRTFRAGGMEGGEGRRFSFGGEGTKVVDCLGLGGGREGDPGSCSGCNSSAARLSTTASIPTVSLAAEECAASYAAGGAED